MPTSTVENYLKAVVLHAGRGDAIVPMGALVEALGVAPGTVTTMVKAMAEQGLLEHQPRLGVRLTGKGRKVALNVLRKHRLVELFLVRILGMDWSEIHDEAEQLEHTISDRVLDRIDALLGHPKFDPHGDAIPDSSGEFRARRLVALSELDAGSAGVVGRIADQADTFLQFVDQNDLRPGRKLRVVARDPQAGIVRARLDNRREVSLGFGAAAKIEVEV
jgi:DtxR family Mn-dependent transcriptional regulator